MATENPYQSPAIPAELFEPEWPAAGVFSDGQYLVLHHTSRLPPVCLKTRLPADTHIAAELVGGLPNDDSVPPSRRRWYGDKVYAIEVPLSNKALGRANMLRLAGNILAVLCLLSLIAALA